MEVIQNEPVAAIDTPEQLVSYIERHCGPWLQEVLYNNLRFYRGVSPPLVNGSVPSSFVLPVRQDREPRDSIGLGHDVYNVMIDIAGGVANRSNSLFCTSSREEARGYGKDYIVLPIGRFHYTWSPEWHDWNITDASILSEHVDGLLRVDLDDALVADAEDEYAAEVLKLEQNIEYMKGREGVQPSTIYSLERDLEELLSERGKDEFFSEHAYDDAWIDGTFTDILLNPDSYYHDRVRSVIRVDEGLVECHSLGHELMVACGAAVYVKPEIYDEYVYPEISK